MKSTTGRKRESFNTESTSIEIPRQLADEIQSVTGGKNLNAAVIRILKEGVSVEKKIRETESEMKKS